MIEIQIPSTTELLFTSELIYQDMPPKRGAPKINLSCGLPSVVNLFKQYADWGQKVPLEIRAQAKQFDFWLVQLFFTLEIARGYRVDWLQVGVQLSHPTRVPARGRIISSIKPGPVAVPLASESPLAYDLFPERVVDQVEAEQTLEISPSLEFMQTKVALGKAALTLKQKENWPSITAFKKRQPDPNWKFEPGATRRRSVDAGIKDLKMIVRASKNKPVKAAIHVEGRGLGYILAAKIAEPSQNEFYF